MFPDPSIVMEGAVNTTTQTLLEYSTFNTTLTTTEDLSKPMCEHKHDTVSHYYTFIGEAYVEPVMFFLGIVTNIVTFIVLYHMSLGKVIKLLLCALSVSDFMASFTAFVNILLEITLFHGEVTHGYWCRGMGVTLTTYYLFLMFISISAALVISLSIIRVYSLRKPFKSRTTLKIRFLVKVIVGIVVSMLILFLPVGFFIVWQLCYKNPLYPQCKAFFDRFPNAEMTEKYLYILSVLFGPLTVVGNLVCLLLLRGYIRKSTKQSIRMQYPADGEQHSTSQVRGFIDFIFSNITKGISKIKFSFDCVYNRSNSSEIKNPADNNN